MSLSLSFYIDALGLQDATFSRIVHADAIVAEVYKATLPTGEQYILKICEKVRHYHHEVFFLSNLATAVPVPRIIQLVPPADNRAGAVLMEYFSGTLLSAQTLTEHIAYELGISLAKVHAKRAGAYGDAGTYPGSQRYADASRYIAEKFEEAFRECERHLSRELLQRCRRYYETHIHRLNAVDGPCWTHRDFRPANIFVSNDSLQGIIDWSSSKAGFAEEDFVSIESEEWNMHADNKRAFYAGYATVRPVPNYTAIMPLLCLVRAFFTIGYTLKSDTWQGNGARAYQSNLRTLERLTT